MEIELSKAGEFLRCYGTKYFISIKEAFEIGRVKFEMVPIGAAGKNGISIYVGTERFLLLCQEINNGAFAKNIAADTGTYPSAYKFLAGKDGHLRLNIGKGTKGIRIQMQDTEKKANYMMAIGYEEMQMMATRFLLFSGMVVPGAASYYQTLIDAFNEGVQKRKSYHKNYDKEDIEEYPNHVEENEDDHEQNPQSQQTQENKDESFSLHVTKRLSNAKGFIRFVAKNENEDDDITLMFRQEDAANLSWFDKFETAVKNGGTTLKLTGERRDNFILWKS